MSFSDKIGHAAESARNAYDTFLKISNVIRESGIPLATHTINIFGSLYNQRKNAAKPVEKVTDHASIQQVLAMPRAGEHFTRDTSLSPFVGSNNMITCPAMQHSKLRAPFEKTFNKIEVASSKEDIAKIAHDFVSQQSLRSYILPKYFEEIAIQSIYTKMGLNEKNCIINGEDLNNDLIRNILKATVSDSIYLLTSKQIIAIDKLLKFGSFPTGSLMEMIQSHVNNGQMSITTAIDQVRLILSAGTLTTSKTIPLIFNLLRHNPKIHNLILAEWLEFQRSFPPPKDRGEFIEMMTLFIAGGEKDGTTFNQSKWLHCLVKEALRMYPVAHTVTRYTIKELQLQNGTTIPAGSKLELDLWEGNRDKKVFGEDADTVRFNRFENDNKRLLLEHLPLLNFSTGAERCLGQNFAKLEILLFTGFYALMSEPLNISDTTMEEPKKFPGIIETVGVVELPPGLDMLRFKDPKDIYKNLDDYILLGLQQNNELYELLYNNGEFDFNVLPRFRIFDGYSFLLYLSQFLSTNEIMKTAEKLTNETDRYALINAILLTLHPQIEHCTSIKEASQFIKKLSKEHDFDFETAFTAWYFFKQEISEYNSDNDLQAAIDIGQDMTGTNQSTVAKLISKRMRKVLSKELNSAVDVNKSIDNFKMNSEFKKLIQTKKIKKDK